MNKNETRLFLEKQFEKLEDSVPASVLDEQGEEEKIEELLEDKFLKAPLSFNAEFVEIFETLPPELRKYLHEREFEVEKGFSTLNDELQVKRFFDELYQTKGCKHGFKDCKDWVEKLVMVEDLLEVNPKETLQFLAKAYGIDLSATDKVATNPAVDVNDFRIAMLSKEMKSLKDEFVERERKFAELMANAKTAQRAKEASFSPRGRNNALVTDTENMTTRQILEKKFAELED